MKEKVYCEAGKMYLLKGILPEHNFRGRLLEIGAGSGWASILIAQKCPDTTVIASDISSKDLRIGMRTARGSGVRAVFFVTCDAEKLPFHGRAFDFVFGNAVIHHLSNVQKGISEIHRVLRDCGKYVGGGELMGNVLFKEVWRRRFLAKLIGRHTIDEIVFTPEDLQRLFGVCGFGKLEIKQEASWHYGPFDHHLAHIYHLIASRLPDIIVSSFLVTEIGVVATKTRARTQKI